MGSYASLLHNHISVSLSRQAMKVATSAIHTHVASFPAYLRIMPLPPGWSGRNSVTSYTSPCTMTWQDSFELCFATSSKGMSFSDMVSGSIAIGKRKERGCRVEKEKKKMDGLQYLCDERPNNLQQLLRGSSGTGRK